MFECTVDNGVTTVWRGSALENCSDSNISSYVTVNLMMDTLGMRHVVPVDKWLAMLYQPRVDLIYLPTHHHYHSTDNRTSY